MTPRRDFRQEELWPVYPEVPGARPTDTSLAAAESVAETAETLREAVFGWILLRKGGGSTADETAEALDLSILTVRPRVSELRAQGRIVDSGERRTNASGRRAIVWIVPPAEAGERPA